MIAALIARAAAESRADRLSVNPRPKETETMLNKELFDRDPRDFALQLVADGLVTADHLLLCCLKYMSHDDARDMLDCNELSPRFDEDNEEEDDEEAEEFELEDAEAVRDAFWDEHPEYEDDRDDSKSQNDYTADIRMAFCDWLDGAAKAGRISDDLAGDVTL